MQNFLISFLLVLTMYFAQYFTQLSADGGQHGTVPPAGRILVIGDSLTSGLYVSHEQASFVSRLGELTGLKIARRHASNLRSATDTWAEVKVWSPSIIVLEIGLNDVSKGVTADGEWQNRYSALVADMKASGATVVVCTMFWAGIREDHANYNRYLRYNEMISHAARTHEALVADLWSSTIGCDECISRAEQLSYFAPHYHGDNFHPSDIGHEIIARTIYGEIDSEVYLPSLVN